MRRTSFKGARCMVAASLEILGEWWTLLVIRAAFGGLTRFEAIQERLGIARNVLTVRLRRLVDDGILEKVRYQEHPPRFEYQLTEKGRQLYPVIVTLMAWGDRWIAGGEPSVIVVDRATGERIEPVLIDRRTGRSVEAETSRLQRRDA